MEKCWKMWDLVNDEKDDINERSRKSLEIESCAFQVFHRDCQTA